LPERKNISRDQILSTEDSQHEQINLYQKMDRKEQMRSFDFECHKRSQDRKFRPSTKQYQTNLNFINNGSNIYNSSYYQNLSTHDSNENASGLLTRRNTSKALLAKRETLGKVNRGPPNSINSSINSPAVRQRVTDKFSIKPKIVESARSSNQRSADKQLHVSFNMNDGAPGLIYDKQNSWEGCNSEDMPQEDFDCSLKVPSKTQNIKTEPNYAGKFNQNHFSTKNFSNLRNSNHNHKLTKTYTMRNKPGLFGDNFSANIIIRQPKVTEDQESRLERMIQTTTALTMSSEAHKVSPGLHQGHLARNSKARFGESNCKVKLHSFFGACKIEEERSLTPPDTTFKQ
jgi:hypothetical protein